MAAWDAAPLLCLEPQEACLQEWGFFEADGLSLLGISGTEINEGHMILMPLLAASGHTDSLTGEEIACVLAGFLREGSKDDAPSINGVSKAVKGALYWIDDQSRLCQETESRYRVHSPNDFWTLSSLWVCITSQWLAGAGISEIATEFGLFDGNVQRGLLRISNLLEEWGSIATLRKDLATLEKLASLRFLRDDIVMDSLYLRL